MSTPKLPLVIVGRGTGALALLAALSLGIAGCGRSPNAGGPGGPPGGARGEMPPAEVGVVVVTPETIAVTAELAGRVSAVRVAEVRARATGILLKRCFEEGADVKADQVLFEIDPAPLQATYDSEKAALGKAQATLERAQADARRKETLVKINGVSQQAFEEARAAARQAEADVQAAKAALDTATLNLGYTKVTAPISGRIGKALVTEGALASAGEATKMAVVKQLDPIYVDFTQASVDLLRLRRSLSAGKLQGLSPREAKVTLVLEDGTPYTETGRLVFSDISVGELTGSVTLRSEFPNPEKVLLPGAFVRGRVEVGVEKEALTVPQRGLARDAEGRASVLLVNSQNLVEQRAIETVSFSGGKWIVNGGLKAGDRVIVEGLQKVGVGSKVNAKPFPGGTVKPAAAATPAAANTR